DNTLQAMVKILDIGLGRFLFDESAVTGQEENTLTTEGSMLGTPEYMAPEQARSAHHVDIRADIYSLGCVLYHVLAGRPPFPAKSPVMQILHHAKDQPQPIRELEPSLPKGLQEVLDSMLAKDPKERYATPKKAAHALEEFMGTRREQLPEA